MAGCVKQKKKWKLIIQAKQGQIQRSFFLHLHTSVNALIKNCAHVSKILTWDYN